MRQIAGMGGEKQSVSTISATSDTASKP